MMDKLTVLIRNLHFTVTGTVRERSNIRTPRLLQVRLRLFLHQLRFLESVLTMSFHSRLTDLRKLMNLQDLNTDILIFVIRRLRARLVLRSKIVAELRQL